jgi:hypothetical protein
MAKGESDAMRLTEPGRYWEPKLNGGHVLIALSLAGSILGVGLPWVFAGGSEAGALKTEVKNQRELSNERANAQKATDERQDEDAQRKFQLLYGEVRAIRGEVSTMNTKLDSLNNRLRRAD